MAGKGLGGGFGLGKMKELADAFKKAQEVQENAKKLQQELEETTIEGQSPDGMVKVVLTGTQEPVSVTISPDALSRGAEEVSVSVTIAMKDAYTKSKTHMESKMEELTSGLSLPGM